MKWNGFGFRQDFELDQKSILGGWRTNASWVCMLAGAFLVANLRALFQTANRA